MSLAERVQRIDERREAQAAAEKRKLENKKQAAEAAHAEMLDELRLSGVLTLLEDVVKQPITLETENEDRHRFGRNKEWTADVIRDTDIQNESRDKGLQIEISRTRREEARSYGTPMHKDRVRLFYKTNFLKVDLDITGAATEYSGKLPTDTKSLEIVENALVEAFSNPNTHRTIDPNSRSYH